MVILAPMSQLGWQRLCLRDAQELFSLFHGMALLRL